MKNDRKSCFLGYQTMFENYVPLTLEELDETPGLHNLFKEMVITDNVDNKYSKQLEAKKFVKKTLKNLFDKEKTTLFKIPKIIGKRKYVCIICNKNHVCVRRNWLDKKKQAKQNPEGLLTCGRCKVSLIM